MTDDHKFHLEAGTAIPWRIDWESKKFTYIGPQLETVLGHSPESWEDAFDWINNIHPDERESVSSYCIAQSEEGADHHADYRALKSDGSYLWVRDVVHVVREGGQTKEILGFIFDISDRKEAEHQLSLEKEKAEDINRMKSQLITTMSHELRTPLTSIIGTLKLISNGLGGEISEETGNLLKIAERNSEQLASLVNDILDVERLESGAIELNLEEIALNDVLEEAAELNTSYAESFGVGITLRSGAATALVSVDRTRLLQVMANLLSNAAKFSSKGSQIEISAELESGHATVKVRNAGEPVDESIRHKIFDKFVCGAYANGLASSGVGLGLSITREIVEKHGGRIDFTSGTGGTEFFFDLPVV